MLHFIVQFIPVEGDHLIEVDLLAARQGADLAALLCTLGAGENGGTQLRIFRKVFLIVHGMTEAQPGVAGNGQAGQNLQQADGPVPLFVFHGLLIQLPVRRQRDSQLRPLQLVFRQFLRHIHPVSAHAHGDQGAVVPLLRGRHHADVHMDVGRNQLMEHILELAEILLDVPLDGFHLLLGVDFGITEFFLILLVIIVRVVAAVILWISLYRLVTNLQGHLFLWQRDTGAAGDGVFIVRRKTDGLAVLQRHITRQHIGGKACQKVP